MYDLLIRNGTIVDGTGNPPYRADLAVAGGRIAGIGRLGEAEAAEVIDAAGLAVAPGFIDMHTHDDVLVIAEPLVEAKTRQGVTTTVTGNCGLGPAPYRGDPGWRSYLTGVLGEGPADWDWLSFDDYLARIQAAGPALNVAPLLTYGAVRTAVMGMDNRSASYVEQATMRNLVREAMVEGAFGMSVGLVYIPGAFATAGELVDLYKAVGEAGRMMDIHLRSQGNQLLESAQEAIEIAARAGVALHISHLCALGRPNWSKRPRLLEMIEAARARGMDITFDQHPYSAASTLLNQVLPPWANAGGAAAITARLRDPASRQRIRDEVLGLREPEDARGWERRAMFMDWDDIMVAGSRTEGVAGKTAAEIGAEWGMEPVDAVLELLARDGGEVSAVYMGLYSEEDIATIMHHPLHMVGSDGVITSGQPHPRLYGSFPRVLGKYCREEKVLDLPTAVQHMTAAPARRLGLTDRGLLREGLAADIVVFDPATVIDTATYRQPRQFPVGIPHVIVNGVTVVRDGEMTGQRPGRVLRAGAIPVGPTA